MLRLNRLPALLACASSILLASAAFADFENYVSKGTDFSVSLPTPVKFERKQEKGLTVDTYMAQADDLTYTIEGGVRINGNHTEEFIKGLESTIPKSIELQHSDSTGDGWSGTQIRLLKDNTNVSTILVAKASDKANAVVYVLLITAPADSEATKKFFQSFKVESSKLAQAYPSDRSTAYELGYTLGTWTSRLLILGGVIAAIVFGVNKLGKKKKTGMPEEHS